MMVYFIQFYPVSLYEISGFIGMMFDTFFKMTRIWTQFNFIL